ncbi:uncharacterized protein LOC143547607 [Bidens hawaiensis]|uniref:uncharacterized protein LOC143547607 n=1 Tax=Bidens hawaiensis TaxID=980011 RepID=UPI00404AF1C7
MASERFPHLKIPLDAILNATNNFHPDNKIGHGDFGPAYQGQLLWNGTSMKIAARRSDHKRRQRNFEFMTEVSMLSDLKHANIVSIIGFCEEDNEKIIVTTYEPNGSLEQFLDSPNLTWTQRLNICVGAARALTYLHSNRGVLHRFINSSTILVDENLEAKLSGFEISIKHSVQQMNRLVLSEPIGTIGYMDPATVEAGGVTNKSDLYSFGIVLFELLCGRKAYIRSEDNKFLDPLAKYHYENKTLKDIIQPGLCNQMSQQSLLLYSEAAYSCLEEKPSHRPDMDSIFAKLEKAMAAQTRREKFVKKLKHLEIRLNDIKLATDNFSKTYIIKNTGFCILYSAKLDHFNNKNSPFVDGKNEGEPSKSSSTVVIKRMDAIYADREDYFFTEIEMLSSVKHSNIATILGFSVESDEMILVTDNVDNLYLDYYLRDEVYDSRRTLSWEKRLRICIDVAKAINYLHSEMEDKKIIIHRDLCSYNIGLDENWRAKIVEFGFSIFLPPNQVNEGIHAKSYYFQRFYADPKSYNTMKIKRESEVYSFGVVLFEILCGKKADDPIYKNENNEGLAFVTIEDKIDSIILEETREKNCIMYTGPNKDSIKTFIKIAKQCVAKSQNQRPTMEDVIKELEKALDFQVNQSLISLSHYYCLKEEDQVQGPDIDVQVVNKLENTLEPQLTHENIPVRSFFFLFFRRSNFNWWQRNIQEMQLKAHHKVFLEEIESVR